MATVKYHYRSLEDFLVSSFLTVDGQLNDGWGAMFPVRGREVNATILFADITAFSSRTFELSPTETLIYVNNFFAWITAEALRGGHGIVDKYIGDEIMVVFSAEFGSENPFVEAVQTARWMSEHDVHSYMPHNQFVIYGGSMKTLIVGAGIIGVIYGWALSEAGIDVTHFVRKGKKEQFKDGVTLDLLDERKGHPKNNTTKYQLKCVEEIAPSDGYELIIVPTNVHQTENALEMLAPVSGQAVFLVFSGNWEGTAFIDRLLPRERYLLGYADGGGTICNGVYWTNLGSEVHLGEVDGQPTEKLGKVEAVFARADIQADVQENIVHWLWTHVAGVVGFAAGFAKHRDVQQYLKDKVLVRQCILSTRELYALCQLRGVDLKKYPEAGFMNFPRVACRHTITMEL